MIVPGIYGDRSPGDAGDCDQDASGHDRYVLEVGVSPWCRSFPRVRTPGDRRVACGQLVDLVTRASADSIDPDASHRSP